MIWRWYNNFFGLGIMLTLAFLYLVAVYLRARQACKILMTSPTSPGLLHCTSAGKTPSSPAVLKDWKLLSDFVGVELIPASQSTFSISLQSEK